MQFRRALVVAVGAVALIAPTAPAFAELYSHADPAQDVVVMTCDEEAEECTEGVDHSVTEGDITRVNIRHQTSNVLIRVKQRELSRVGIRGHYVRIVTNEGRENFVQMLSWDGSTRPDYSVLTRRDGETEIKCANLWTGYDVSTEIATIIVPRRCLSYPRWVRVGVGAFAGSPDLLKMGADDAMIAGRVSDDTVALSPRIRRN